MSSTTSVPQRHRDPRRIEREKGQVLVIFAGGLVAFLAIAALVFDVGQNLFDWRVQRDAADAAALAGARYVATAANYNGTCSATLTGNSAVDAACVVARANGYGNPQRGVVDVHTPPIQGPYKGDQQFIEVDIHTDRPSFFAAVLGVLQQNVNALAVAGNSPGFSPPYSMLSLNLDCNPNPSGQVGGNGNVNVGGSVVVDSNCDGALLVNGNGSLVAPECDVVGTGTTAGGNANMDCTLNEGPDWFAPDPLAGLPPPPVPQYPPANVEILHWNGKGAPLGNGCPGSIIAFVGDTFAAGASVSLSGIPYEPYDIALVYAYSNASNTAPLPPSGWTKIYNSNTGADGNSRWIGYRVLQGNESSSYTWSGATATEVIVLRGENPKAPIGATALGGSNTTTLTTPALTLQRTDGTSWVVAFAGSKATDANTKDLSSTTTRSGSVGALALHTGEGIVSWASRDYSSPVNAAVNRTDAVEIVAGPNPSTAAQPLGCQFNNGFAEYNIYRIHPGVYYGGIKINGNVRVYMAPGTYWLAGGGLDIGGSGSQLVSVDGVKSTNPGRGVLLYDTEDSYYHNQCANPVLYGAPPAGACIGSINANGGSDAACPTSPWPQPDLAFPYGHNPPAADCAWVHLESGGAGSVYPGLLIYVDRNLTTDVFFNGSTGIIELYGTIYDPNGAVIINGDAGDTVAAQVIAYTFKITGNGGFTVTYNSDYLFKLKGAGLVQ